LLSKTISLQKKWHNYCGLKKNLIVILKADSISIKKKPNQLRGWYGKPRVLKNKDSRVALNDYKRRPGFFFGFFGFKVSYAILLRPNDKL